MNLRNKKVLAAAVGVVALAAGGIAYAIVGTAGGTSTQNETVVFGQVQTRTLQDTVTLSGTLARKQIRNVDAANQGLVSTVTATNGSTTQAGDAMFALNGRTAVAEDGTVRFFRALTLGDQGADVLQLKQILAAAGDYPGPMNNYFNQQTQFALAQWQAQHDYPNTTPATPQSVTVALQQGTGYKVGSQDAAGLIIGPPPAQTAALATGRDRTAGAGAGAGVGTAAGAAAGAAGADATLASYADSTASSSTGTPVLTIQSVDDQVAQGQPATFVVSSSAAVTNPLTVSLTPGGTAGAQDVVSPPTSVTLPAGATQVSVTVQTRVTTAVAPDRTIELSVAAGTGYTVGNPGVAETTIKNPNVPALTITGATTVTPGASATLTVTASQPPLQDLQVGLAVTGSATAGTDYDPVNPVVTLPAGSTSATVTVQTVATTVIEPDKYLSVSVTPSAGNYTVTTPGSAVVTISESGAEPVVTLQSPTTYLKKGQPFTLAVGLSKATSTPLTVHLSYSGTAVRGTDYTVPPGNIVVPAGQTALKVTVPTVTSNTVEADRVLTVALAPSGSYVVGTPNSATATITSTVVPTLTLTASTSSVAQGGSASFTITASQPPVKDTSVNFTAQGTAEPGQSYVPLSGTALLRAGQTQVTVALQTLQTDVQFEPTDMIVGHWPIRIGQVYVKAGQPVAAGTAILSLTEPNLSVTLQATAADRTKLKVGQHCTVQISGQGTQGTGTITELNRTPTVTTGSGGQSSQVYEGRIEVSDFSGADGSQVTINVVDQQVDDALTVPIAAVLQNGAGHDVVRVIDLSKGGRVTTVPVRTGLTEGSYIQIKGGALRPGQTVVLQTNQSK
ncbi:MAG TPA: Calx-beta domain-containing protein [Acidimicrobiales bacterium]|nr:Calx-beta domain-containing protein [Acidimicrobiales bacterium]